MNDVLNLPALKEAKVLGYANRIGYGCKVFQDAELYPTEGRKELVLQIVP